MRISDRDVLGAAVRLDGVVIRTPVLFNEGLDRVIQGHAYLKAESLQRGGSFKYRGVMNKLLANSLRPGDTLVAYSSGNHAISVAMAARRCGCSALLLMPADAPAIKIRLVSESGGEIVFYDRTTQDRVVMAESLCAERGGLLFPPFDDAQIIAGQATATLELIEQCRAMGCELDDILLPCGGGGLLSGGVLGARAARSSAKIWAAEPEGFDRMGRSIEMGCKVENPHASGSICDALMTRAPADLTFGLALEGCCGSLTPSDAAVRHAVAFSFAELKLVLEPSGAIALAGLISAGDAFRGRSVGVVLSGGNVDSHTYVAACEADRAEAV